MEHKEGLKTVDLLCFGAHPDDVEIGMGGTIAKHVAHGFRVGICDLTLAELSSNGTLTDRQAEAEEAAAILDVSERVNLRFQDRGLGVQPDVIRAMTATIRRLKPQVVFAPYEDDRHPDHGIVARLAKEAVFNAGIRRYESGLKHDEPHQVKTLYFYLINSMTKPDLLVNITDYVDVKKQALLAYRSQFISKEGVKTRLNTGFIDALEGRDRWFGKAIQTSYAEGFKAYEALEMHLLAQ